MQRSLFEARFYETYYFANTVRNILYNQFAYLRKLDEFYGDGSYIRFIYPYPKYSAFHCFIEFIITSILDDEIGDVDLVKRQETVRRFSSLPQALSDLKPSSLPINEALNYYKIEHTSFDQCLKEHNKNFLEATLDDIADYYTDLQLEEAHDTLIELSVQEVFFILFQNRRLLLIFNEMMAHYIAATDIDDSTDEYGQYFAGPGILKRVSLPKWVRRAVFFRDRGLCTSCLRDLSGFLNIGNTENFDHIVPLARGGLNDVTNIQLLCRECNLRKREQPASTSDYYEAWYSMSEGKDV